MISSSLTFLRNNNMWSAFTREVLGSNLPHIAIVQNKNELVDQAINQFGNTAAVFGGGLLSEKAIDGVFKRLHRPLANKPNKLVFLKAANPWFMLGKAFAIYSIIASFVVASPFIRNYITLKRTKIDTFVDMVGLNQAKTGKKMDNQAIQDKQQRYLTKFIAIGGAGFLIAGGLLGLTHLLITRKIKFPSLLGKLQNFMGLKDGRYQNFPDAAVFAFWALPAYVGLYTGSRDMVEKQESLLKTAGYALGVMGLPHLFRFLFNSFFKGRRFGPIGPAENAGFLLQLGLGTVFYGAMPSIVGLLTRRIRAQKAGLLDKQSDPADPGTRLSDLLTQVRPSKMREVPPYYVNRFAPQYPSQRAYSLN